MYLNRGLDNIPQDKFVSKISSSIFCISVLCFNCLLEYLNYSARYHQVGILGVYQKMVSVRKHEKEGFMLLSSVVENLTIKQYLIYNKQINFVLFTRLSKSKTKVFVQGLYSGSSSSLLHMQHNYYRAYSVNIGLYSLH